MRMFVAGGTGVLGRPLVAALVDRGHEVTASTHRTENFSVIAALGASRDYAMWLAVTNRLRSEGTKTLMTAAREAGTRRVVAQSASFMTQPVGSGPTDESSPLYLEAPEPIRSHTGEHRGRDTGVGHTGDRRRRPSIRISLR